MKKHIVKLTKREREVAQQIVKLLDGSPEKVRRAQILLKTDSRCGWPDAKIAEAYSCTVRTVENVRRRFVESGFEITLGGKRRDSPPRQHKFNGDQEAHIIAMRLGEPPEGYAGWTLSLLQERIVELEIVESVSRETIRRTLKKRHETAKGSVLGHPS